MNSEKIKEDILYVNEYYEAVIWGISTCPYCMSARELLPDAYWVDITSDKDYHEILKEMFGQKTVPYVFIDNVFIGGRDDLALMVNI